MTITRQDLNTAIKRIEPGQSIMCSMGAIAITKYEDGARELPIAQACAYLAKEFDPSGEKLSFSKPEDQYLVISDARFDMELFAQFVREKGKGLIEKILKEQQSKVAEASRA